MPDNPRNTQFLGFARTSLEQLKPSITLLCVELSRANEQGISSAEDIICQILARLAHDLVAHTLRNTGPYMLDCLPLDEQVAEIPDLAKLPEEKRGE